MCRMWPAGGPGQATGIRIATAFRTTPPGSPLRMTGRGERLRDGYGPGP
jgi:hypothetical protein